MSLNVLVLAKEKSLDFWVNGLSASVTYDLDKI